MNGGRNTNQDGPIVLFAATITCASAFLSMQPDRVSLSVFVVHYNLGGDEKLCWFTTCISQIHSSKIPLTYYFTHVFLLKRKWLQQTQHFQQYK